MSEPVPVPAPWHPGEIALQTATGAVERMADMGRRVIRDHLIDQHRKFYPLLPMIVLGAVDPEGEAWATVRAGQPGFMQARDDHHLHLDLDRDPSDPADRGMADGDAVGLLGIQLSTRRRNRLNGRLERTTSGFDLAVAQSFGNCPQYIQARDYTFRRDPRPQSGQVVETGERLDARARAMIEAADTFFVASYVDLDDGRRQVDVSHRGGRPGFVRVAPDGELTIPDFPGNFHFATLGNLLVNPRAGLVFVDFVTGDMLQLTGDAEVVLESDALAAFQGAERLWRLRPRRWVFRPGALPLTFTLEEWSPNTLMTGTWGEADKRLAAGRLGDGWRSLRVARIVDESAGIRSFHLEPADAAGLVKAMPGQHLPIRVTLPCVAEPVIRTYTLSSAPSDDGYRISVKRDGSVSAHLHDQLTLGALLEARPPAGAFTIDAAAPRPAVLLAAGIGITPMIAMLRHLVYEGLRTRKMRPTWLFQAARTRAERAFDAEIERLVDASVDAIHLVRVLSDPTGAEPADYDVAGRIDIDLLKATLPFDDYDFYLCGPPAFMQGAYDGLRRLNIANERIHAEAFGPSSLVRDDAPVGPPMSEAPVAVRFAAAAVEAVWQPGSGSLLDLAEQAGLQPEYACRGGTCGSCRTRLLSGDVGYMIPPTAPVSPDEVLICCAVPAAGTVRLDLDL